MLSKILKILVTLWKFVSFPLFGERCRFYPSCSEYLLEAVDRHGVMSGGYLGVKRICRCHPMSEGGVDAVPKDLN
jgi:putative membrane protein insertion efficiency factor